MNRRFGFSIFWTLLVFLIIGAVAAIAYHAGATVAVGNSGAAGVDPRYYYPGWGLFGLFPLLFFILILFLVFRPRRWYGRHWSRYGPWGYGPWSQPGPGNEGNVPPVPPHIEQMFQAWHRQAHGESPPAGGTPTGMAP